MKTDPTPPFGRLLAILLATAFFTGGCQTAGVGVGVNRLREAQDAFNVAAALENRTQLVSTLGIPGADESLGTQLSQSPGEALISASQVRAGYAAALQSLRQIDEPERAQLQRDQLLGTVLSLQALSEWKLGLHEDALRSADQAAQAGAGLFPRDAAVIAALPGLIKIDLAYATIAAMEPRAPGNIESFEAVRQRLVGKPGQVDADSAVNDLRLARQKAGPLHPVTVYLIECQLAAFRNYQVAHQRVHGLNPPPDDPAAIEASHNLHELVEFLETMNARPLAAARLSFWRDNYAIVPESRPAR